MGFLTTFLAGCFTVSHCVFYTYSLVFKPLFFPDFIAIIFAIKSHVPFQSASDFNVFYTYPLVFKPLFLGTPDFYVHLKFQYETCDIL